MHWIGIESTASTLNHIIDWSLPVTSLATGLCTALAGLWVSLAKDRKQDKRDREERTRTASFEVLARMDEWWIDIREPHWQHDDSHRPAFKVDAKARAYTGRAVARLLDPTIRETVRNGLDVAYALATSPDFARLTHVPRAKQRKILSHVGNILQAHGRDEIPRLEDIEAIRKWKKKLDSVANVNENRS